MAVAYGRFGAQLKEEHGMYLLSTLNECLLTLWNRRRTKLYFSTRQSDEHHLYQKET